MTTIDVSNAEHLRLRIVEMVRNQGRGDVNLAKTRAPLRDNFDKAETVRSVLNQQGQLKPDTVTDRSQYQALPSAYRSKSRAAAWLIRRFHKRQDRHVDSTLPPKSAKPAGKQFDHEHVLPVNQAIDLSTKSKARNVDPFLNNPDKGQEQISVSASASPKKMTDSNVLTLRTDVKSHLVLTQTGRSENKGLVTAVRSNPVLLRGDHDVSYDPRKDKPRGVNKLQEIYTAEPVYLKHDRRKGIFSASLENFKKRLQMASNKIGTLNEDKENIAENTNDHLGYVPLNHVPHPPPLPTKPASGKKARSGQEDVYANTNKLEQIHAQANGKELQNAQKASNVQRFLNSGKRTPQFDESKINRDVFYRNRKPLSRIGENEPEETETRTSTSRIRITPVPLTMHNLRVHDSLQSAYERRKKRLNPHPPTQLQLQQQVIECGSFTPVPGDRMWQWLDEVTLESTCEPTVMTVLALHSGRDQVDQIETPRHFKENIEIFV